MRCHSKFASHYIWQTNGVCECNMDVNLHGFLHGIEWTMFHGHFDYYHKPPLGGRSNTKSRDHGTSNNTNRWFILLYHVWGPSWIEIHWCSIWLRAQSHMTSHYTWGVHDHTIWFWRCLGTAFGHFLLGSHKHDHIFGHGSWLVCEVALIRGLLALTVEASPIK